MIGAAALSVSLLAAVAEPLVRVSGSSVCPRPAEVTEQLSRLLPARPAGVEPDRAELERTDSGFRLVLRLADGSVVGEKELDAAGSCHELAEAVALVIAIWERPLRPGLLPPLPALASAEGPRSEDRPAPSAPAPAPSPTSPPRDTVAEAAPARASASPHRSFEVGAGVSAHVSGKVPGAVVEGQYRHRSGLGARLAVSAAAFQSTSIAPGRVEWTRLSAEAGLRQSIGGDALFLELHERFLASVLVAEGRGYESTKTRTVFDPGVAAALRAGHTFTSSFRWWIELAGAFRPIERTLRVQGLEGAARTSRFDSILSLGVSFAPGH